MAHKSGLETRSSDGLHDVPGQEEAEAHHDQIRKHEDADGGDQVPTPWWVFTKSLFELIDDLLVAVLHNKDIVKEHRGQTVDGQGEQDRLRPGVETVMFNEMEIEGFE